MPASPSIGVLIPTLNCAKLVASHVESLQPWIDLATEVVVVDSGSTDGTVEYLKTNLRHPNLRLLQHPRGLYQSWNFGISKLTSRFTYISTVGDSISREGLGQLLKIADTRQCDVVVSKPRFVDNNGRVQRDTCWPIDDVRRHFPGCDPVVLEGIELSLLALTNCTSAILGSSASNLYRTRCLQERPFPTEYGTVGDGAWGLINACDVRIGFTGEIFSTFRDHPKSYPASEYFVDSLKPKLFKLACERLRNHFAEPPEKRMAAKTANLDAIIQALGRHLDCQWRLEECRGMKLPWIINPAAWAARIGRGMQARKLDRLKAAALKKIRARGPGPLVTVCDCN